MTALDIHPEDLIDKWVDCTLTGTEQDRLQAHLEQCASCRVELAVRADFAVDLVNRTRPQLSFEQPPLPSAEPLSTSSELTPQRAPITLIPRARRRWPLVLMAAAFVLFAGVATAAVVSGSIGARLPWAGQSKSPVPGLAAALSRKRAQPMPKAALPEPNALESSSSALAPSAAPQVLAPVKLDPAPARTASVTAPSSRRLVAAGAVSGASSLSPASSSLPVDAAAVRVAPDASAQPDAAPRSDASALFAEANRARRDGNAERALQLYRSLQNRYPSSAESELSRAVLAQMLLERGNAEGALAGFDRYLAQDSPALSAEALVGRARALEQLGRRDQAVAAWQEVQRRFPGSVHARLAAVRLAALDPR